MYIPNLEFVKPRKPREVVFAVGGWSGLFPTWVIETYDPRADRWINVFKNLQSFSYLLVKI